MMEIIILKTMLCTKQNIDRLISSFVNHLHMILDTVRSIVILGNSKKRDAESITPVTNASKQPTTGSIHGQPENNAKYVQNTTTLLYTFEVTLKTTMKRNRKERGLSHY